MRPTWRVVGAVALWLVLEWYGATSEVSWLFLLAAWVLALVAACGAYALWNRAGLSLHLAVARSRPAGDSPAEELPETVLRTSPYAAPLFEKDGLELAVGLRTTSGARGPAWINGQVGDTEIRFATGVVPTRGWSRLKVLRELRRGPVGASGWTIGTSDPLGFFRGQRSCPDSEVGLVLPRLMSLVGLRQARELEASAAVPRSGSGNELFGIREYRPGDSLRRIHWRSSARHGELVVREYEPPGLQTLAIYLDPEPPSDDVADQIARIAASEAWDCLREGGRVVLWAPGLEPSGSPRDLWTQLEWLARYPDVPSSNRPTDSPDKPSSSPKQTSDRPDYPGFAGTSPAGAVVEVVVITARANEELFEASERARRRRGWVVGEAVIDADIPLQRVGTQWPLP
ncbi:MAG: DUF58 domain-containing protein [Chloroflexi bacterium]|nr:MAG: DUF58 domain-containing protein [Chloroflexota bacterium]